MDSERNDYSQSGFSPYEGQEGPAPNAGGPPRDVPPEPPRYGPPSPSSGPYPEPRRRSSGWRVLWGILFGLSVLVNVGLLLLLLGLVVAFVVGTGPTGYSQTVLREGPRSNRIVVINIRGIIDELQAEDVRRQLRLARNDRAVRGIIVRVNSPGGSVGASDRIYREIADYRKRQGQPAVAFMQSVAASGGYYAAVACEQIIAEPTAITGSIGVALTHFVLQELLEDKLGIQPVFLIRGQRKDWPSMFRPPSDEELAYLTDRLLEPAYQRFVEVVKQGRRQVLSEEEVMKLADGSVFVAEEARAVRLIDRTGYLDDAIEMVKEQAGITRAQVIEYRRPLSFLSLLLAEGRKTSLLNLDRAKLFDLTTPQVMYLWNGY